MGQDKNVVAVPQPPVEEEKKKWKISLRTLALAQPSKHNITPKYCKGKSDAQYAVSRAALKAKSSPRLAALAEYNKHNARKKYDPSASAPEILVKKGALKARCSPRSEMLARNIVVKMQMTLESFPEHGDYFKATMKKYLDLAKSSMYRELYWKKPPPRVESIPFMKSCMYTNTCPPPKKSREMLAELAKWCDENSHARPDFLPPPLPPAKKKPLSELQKRFPVLAAPRDITKKYNAVEADQFSTGVPKACLKYVPSARVKELSKPQERPEPPVNPSEISPTALTAVARSRTVELSKPRPRTQGDNDEKENPYAVKPEALTAYCSNRTKELAKPRKS